MSTLGFGVWGPAQEGELLIFWGSPEVAKELLDWLFEQYLKRTKREG